MLRILDRAAGGPSRVTRRELLRAGMLAAGGLTLADLLRAEARAVSKQQRPARAKHCILVFLNGGPSQLDTFDLKPEAPSGIRGPFKPISTRVPGIQITEKLPRLAQLADKFSIVRSLHHHLAGPQHGGRLRAFGPLARFGREHRPDGDGPSRLRFGRLQDLSLRVGHSQLRPHADVAVRHGFSDAERRRRLARAELRPVRRRPQPDDVGLAQMGR